MITSTATTHQDILLFDIVYPKCNFDFKTSWQAVGSVLVNMVTLALWGVLNESQRNSLNGDASHVTQNPTALMKRSSKLCQITFMEVFICNSLESWKKINVSLLFQRNLAEDRKRWKCKKQIAPRNSLLEWKQYDFNSLKENSKFKLSYAP